MRSLTVAAILWTSLCAGATAEPVSNEAAVRAVHVDTKGVVRWNDDDGEVALYGANYCVMSGSDYRMAGLLGRDRKAMIDEDMAQFARMGWTALRLCSWGDWENSDAAGNLILNEHVDLLDYLIAKARERGIYMLLTPIHTYNPAFADQLNEPTRNVGFSRYFDRTEMGTNPKSIAAQAAYIKNLLAHVNPYTGVAIKDEPAILFLELINEPVHHPEDMKGSVNYINTLVGAAKAAGSRQITFYNVSQDFAIGAAIRQSNVEGVSFGWYPSSLVAGFTLKGNFLQSVDGYPDMLRPELAGKPRIVYEFDQPDLLTGYMYPAMARTFRSVGTQFATMFAYDMLETAPYNLGWQTHFLNLVHTPRKAVSAVIAAEAMRRLPRMTSYPHYPASTKFGDFRVSYEDDSSELNADDAFMNAGPTKSSPKNPRSLTRIVGFGSSGAITYEGTGAYFLDKVRDGEWRLEVYPDEVLVRDPFGQPRPDSVVSRLLRRSWPMGVHLPDLGAQYFATPINVPDSGTPALRRADGGTVHVEPGIWLLSRAEHPDRAALPARINRVGFDEYHVNAPVAYPDFVVPLSAKEFSAGQPVEIRVRVANTALPDEATLWLRTAGTKFFANPIAMRRAAGNDFVATVPAERAAAGLYEYLVSVRSGTRVTSFPGGVDGQPGTWPFHADVPWAYRVTPGGVPMRLLDPKEDYPRLLFVRPGEQYRSAFFEIAPGETADEAALVLYLPDLGKDTPERYATALYIGDAIAARSADASHGTDVTVQLRAVGGKRKTLELTLIEKDGTAWAAPIVASDAWTDVRIPLGAFHIARSIHIPSPYPGLWNYWRESPAARGQAGDHVELGHVERLQLAVFPNRAGATPDDARGVAVESVRVGFTPRP